MIEAIARAATVYFDTAPLIYLMEDRGAFADLVAPAVEAIDAGRKRGLSSYVTLIEILVKPLRANRPDLANQYRRLLLGQLHLYEVDARVAEEAAYIRAQYKLKVPDAIQLGTARVHGADVFVTNDRRLGRFAELPIVVLADHVASS